MRRLCILVIAAAIAAPVVAATRLEAPNLTLTSLSGPAIRLGDLRGKVVLLDFWASWCVPCRRSFPEIDALHRELEPKGLAVIAVNVDEQRKNADAFLSGRPHTMPIALDPTGSAAQAFKLQAMPSTIIVDRNGQIRFTHEGYTDQTIGQYRAEVLQLLAEAR